MQVELLEQKGARKSQLLKPEWGESSRGPRGTQPKASSGDQPIPALAGEGLTSSALSVKVSLGPRLRSLSRITVSAPLV